MREWVIYALIMAVVFAVFFNDGSLIGALAGLLVSGPLYLALGATLAKLGYQRKSIKEMRAERTAPRSAEPAAATSATAPRARPAPTRRTSTGHSNRPKTKRRR